MLSTTMTREITRNQLQVLEAPQSASISNLNSVSSYNWIEATTPTIAVPGSPALWSPPRGSRRVERDSGLIYIAQNAARHPDSPLEPLFRSLYTLHPSFDIRSTDVVTDRNNLRKLLAFVNPSTTRNGCEPFTINVEMVEGTAIFCRSETATMRFIKPHEFKGFGHEFEKAYTVNQIRGSTGHHRVVSYQFGDLKFIVRHETDGYVDTCSDSLAHLLGGLSLSTDSDPPSTTPAGSKLTILEQGQTVSIESSMEIKTRVAHRRISFNEVAPQLWISQTPKLVRAYHRHGIFQEPKVEDVGTEIKKWEDQNQSNLKMLAALIKKIIEEVKACGGKADVRYNATNKLVICKVVREPMLPADLYAQWDSPSESEPTDDTKHDKDVPSG